MNYPLVGDIASPNIIYLDSSAKLSEAIKLITEKNVRNIIVHDSNIDQYAYVGVDEVVHSIIEKIDEDSPLHTLGLHPLIILPKKYNIFEASYFFIENESLLGVYDDDGTLFGVVSFVDILKASMKMSEDMLEFPVRSLVLKNSAIMTNKGVVLDTLIKNLDSMPTDCIVVHENNIPKGIITKKDITYRIAKKEPLDCLVEECMSYPILSINGDITIRKALDIMNEHRYKRIFVTDNDGELLGIITQKELVSVIYHKFSHKTVKSIDKLNHILEKKVNSKSEEIIEIKERYEHALSASTHGLWDWNLITDEIVISQQLENMLGIEKKSVKSMSLNFYNLIDENDRVKVISAREKAMDNDKEMFEVEYRIIDKNNNYIWVKDRARIIYNNGCPIRIVATVSNITEHKNMQDEIKKTKRYFIPSGTS